MSDKRDRDRRDNATCDMCARVTPTDIARGYCPTTATRMHRGMSASRCRFFVEAEDCDSMRGRRRHVH